MLEYRSVKRGVGHKHAKSRNAFSATSRFQKVTDWMSPVWMGAWKTEFHVLALSAAATPGAGPEARRMRILSYSPDLMRLPAWYTKNRTSLPCVPPKRRMCSPHRSTISASTASTSRVWYL